MQVKKDVSNCTACYPRLVRLHRDGSAASARLVVIPLVVDSESLSINVMILILVGVNSFILLFHGYIVLVFCIYYSVVD
jgi:hypothetical protein